MNALDALAVIAIGLCALWAYGKQSAKRLKERRQYLRSELRCAADKVKQMEFASKEQIRRARALNAVNNGKHR